MSDRLSVGVPPLDRTLDGGLPVGGVTALTASAASQSELLLSKLAAGRETAYLSTERPASAVRSAMADAGVDVENLTIYDVGRETPVLDARQYVREHVDQELLVVEPVNPLERRDRDQYSEFLTTLGRMAESEDLTAVLYGLSGPAKPEGRAQTLYMADVVLDLRTKVDADAVSNRLVVPKYRGGRAVEEPIRLELTEDVRMDTTRDIA